MLLLESFEGMRENGRTRLNDNAGKNMKYVEIVSKSSFLFELFTTSISRFAFIIRETNMNH